MIGGYLKSTSCAALVAAAGIVMSGVTAQAADLGGNCCADLEERVAELEATTVRKGNRKVSLQIYGQVSEAVIWWNDGAERNVYVQENNAVKNIIGFTGGAKINSDWSAGFKVELQVRAYRSSAANQASLGENNAMTITAYNTQSVSLRHMYWELASRTYGTIRVGRDADAAVGTGGINLANPDGFASNGGFMGFANGGFYLRRSGTVGNNGLSALTWQNFAYQRNGDGPTAYDYAQTASQVKYISPFFLGQSKSSGFQVQGSWGQDEMWAAALRYVEDFGTFRMAAGVSYSDWRGIDRTSCTNPTTAGGQVGTVVAANTGGAAGTVTNVNCHAVQASGSVMHTPTGLYVSGGGARLTDANRQIGTNLSTAQTNGAQTVLAKKDDSSWWIQGGWEAKLNALGKTTFWGQYAEWNMGTGVASNVVQTMASTDVLNSIGATAIINSTKTQAWGMGVTQAIDAAAMNLYLGYMNFSTGGTITNLAGTVSRKTNAIDDMQMVYTGATIRF